MTLVSMVLGGFFRVVAQKSPQINFQWMLGRSDVGPPSLNPILLLSCAFLCMIKETLNGVALICLEVDSFLG